MIIKNKTNNTIVSSDAKQAVSLLDLIFGLLLKSNPRSMLFTTRFGIHTFGMRESIDVIVLDNNLKVIKVKENLKPNRIFFWNPKYDLVLELQTNTIKKTSTEIGDMLVFK